jgi:hypothetical protein
MFSVYNFQQNINVDYSYIDRDPGDPAEDRVTSKMDMSYKDIGINVGYKFKI